MMPTSTIPFIRWLSIEPSIRHGSYPERADLLYEYLGLGEQIATRHNKHYQQQLYIKEKSVLLEAVCDCCLPIHWRQLCLDNLYSPLRSLRSIMQSPNEQHQLKSIEYEITTLSHYFLAERQQSWN
ncbi:hypothetical protein [Pleionea sp. CnH1-48]|uniref:hypothetical protein n=1 Tax=Pleionea sp. CnH1-48 TaxID=2954494 RepID=UPI002097F18D|nr:hypothetical protein [Pleionea sp. CnH1-48]MCO7222913.1 hypothetical protein [Pleionea sp. CnH1-48]